jgi:hypothetical protein
MQNIDPLYFLQPAGTIAFSAGLVIYWHRKRHFTRAAFVYSLFAYAGVIAIKIVVQVLTYNAFLTRFGNSSPALGAYFGVQTVLFEVGGAFLVAAWAVSRGKLNAKDAEGYGLGLAFWENAGYLGVLGALSLASTYLALASGGLAAQEFYSSLSDTRPDLFYPPSLALPLVGYGLLERVTSLLFHFSWGYLCLLAAFLHKRRYFLLALPMGLVDFFVPFAASLSILVSEAFIFVLGLGSLGLTLLVTRSLRHHDRPAEGLATEFKKAVPDDAPDLTEIMTRAFDDDARSSG